VLTLTLNPALDVSMVVHALEPDRKMYGHDVREQPGGGGVNVARVAYRLGSDVTAIVVAGGATGTNLIELLRAEQVPVEAVHIAGETRRNLTVVEETTGRQYRFVMPGPHVATECLDEALAALLRHLDPLSIVVISGSLPPGLDAGALAEVAARLIEEGAALIVDVPGDVLAAMASVGTVLLKPSVRELGLFVNRSLDTHLSIDCAARALLALGPNRAALVSLGPTGALLVQPDEPSLWIHAPHVRVMSTVGAGDSLVAACAVALERGAPMVDAARFGVAAGSAATMVAGTGLCDATTVESLLCSVAVTEVTGS
jgi:6-phosphofructokinase 2